MFQVCLLVVHRAAGTHHIKADTHTQGELAAQSGGTPAEGLRRVVGLGAQLGNGGEMGTVAIVPDVQGDLEQRGVVMAKRSLKAIPNVSLLL